jgi:hypothetical protein
VRHESEADLQRAVMQLARTLHWKCSHIGDSRKQVRDRQHGHLKLVGDPDAAGMLDLILVRERVLWIELKDAKNRIRPAQQRWIDALVNAGQEVHIWRPADFDSGLVLNVLARKGRLT